MLDKRKIQRNKKAQLGETMTWIVATLIIIVALIMFIYTSSILAKIKVINLPDLKIDSEKDINWLETKTLFAHSQSNNQNKEKIDEWIKKGEDGNEE